MAKQGPPISGNDPKKKKTTQKKESNEPEFQPGPSEQKKEAQGKPFKIDEAFSNYLRVRGLDSSTLTPETVMELRNAYFGGCAQMYVLLALEIPNLPQEHQQKAVNYIADLLNKYAKEEEEAAKAREAVKLSKMDAAKNDSPQDKLKAVK